MNRVSCGTPYLQAGEVSCSINDGDVTYNVDVAAIQNKILVSDIERTLSCYRDVLGLKIVTHCRLDSEKIKRLAGRVGVHLRATVLGLGERVFGTVALIEFIEAGGQPFFPFKNKLGRLADVPFAKFRTKQIDSVFAGVERAGLEIIYPPVTPYRSSSAPPQHREFMFRDKCQNPVKLTELDAKRRVTP